MLERLLAFSLDLLFCGFICLGFVSLVGFSLDISSEEIFEVLGYSSIAIFTFCVYMLYFSLFDLSMTLGKQMLGIKLRPGLGSEITLTKTFSRELITFLGIAFLGLPSLLGLSDSWSGTEVRN